MGGRLVAIDLDRDVFDEGAQQLLPVARRGRWRVPDGGEIGFEGEETIALGLRDYPRPLFFAAFQPDLGRLKCAQALLPVAFEAARHQPVVRIDSAIATLGALRFRNWLARPRAATASKRLRVRLPAAQRRPGWRQAQPAPGQRRRSE